MPNVAHNGPYESQSLFLGCAGTVQRLLYTLTTSVIQVLITKKKTWMVTWRVSFLIHMREFTDSSSTEGAVHGRWFSCGGSSCGGSSCGRSSCGRSSSNPGKANENLTLISIRAKRKTKRNSGQALYHLYPELVRQYLKYCGQSLVSHSKKDFEGLEQVQGREMQMGKCLEHKWPGSVDLSWLGITQDKTLCFKILLFNTLF